MKKQERHIETVNTSALELVRALARQAAQEYFRAASNGAQLDKTPSSSFTDGPCSGDS